MIDWGDRDGIGIGFLAPTGTMSSVVVTVINARLLVIMLVGRPDSNGRRVVWLPAINCLNPSFCWSWTRATNGWRFVLVVIVVVGAPLFK